jgi:hypothetical protein
MDSAVRFIQAGYSDVRTDAMAIIIALLVVIVLMKSWGQLIMLTIGSVILHEIIWTIIPLAQGHKFAMPAITTGAFWTQAGLLAVGYFLLIIIFFFLKNNVFKIGRSSSSH